MTRPRFLLDCDGVVADFLGSALQAVHAVTGVRYQPEDFPTWDIFDVIGSEHEGACYERFREQGFCAGIDPYPGAADGVAGLLALADVQVVTSPVHGPHWYFERAEWVARHLRIPSSDVTFKKQKQYEYGDYLLDDRPKHVEAWAERHPHGLALLWDQPYNRGADAAAIRCANVKRVLSWDAVIALVAGGSSWTS